MHVLPCLRWSTQLASGRGTTGQGIGARQTGSLACTKGGCQKSLGVHRNTGPRSTITERRSLAGDDQDV